MIYDEPEKKDKKWALFVEKYMFVCDVIYLIFIKISEWVILVNIVDGDMHNICIFIRITCLMEFMKWMMWALFLWVVMNIYRQIN